ncbi:MAG: hypothetical protein KDA60_03670, partial [Planctomycetales bacterium]|nr:hypothetical protein [Planctomycetales bacterium]
QRDRARDTAAEMLDGRATVAAPVSPPVPTRTASNPWQTSVTRKPHADPLGRAPSTSRSSGQPERQPIYFDAPLSGAGVWR